MTWIKCSERMPEYYTNVLLYHSPSRVILSGYRLDILKCWTPSAGNQEFKESDITHWMPLPEPPIDKPEE